MTYIVILMSFKTISLLAMRDLTFDWRPLTFAVNNYTVEHAGNGSMETSNDTTQVNSNVWRLRHIYHE